MRIEILFKFYYSTFASEFTEYASTQSLSCSSHDEIKINENSKQNKQDKRQQLTEKKRKIENSDQTLGKLKSRLQNEK